MAMWARGELALVSLVSGPDTDRLRTLVNVGPLSLAEVEHALFQTPETLHALVDPLPVGAVTFRTPVGGRSPLETVSYMASTERNEWMRQVRLILHNGERACDGPPAREIVVRRRLHQTMASAVAEFERHRLTNVAALRALDLRASDLSRTNTDPEFGTVSLRTVLETWLKHDLVGLAQISRQLLRYYQRDLKPWTMYFSLLAGFEARAAVLTSGMRSN